MKKKGFTLIELLAVIVILAIIALIATPLVLKYIEKSRTNSKITSTQNYIKAVETSLASYSITNKGKSYPEGCYEINTLNTDLDISIKGDIPTEGKVCIENNKIEKAIVKYPDNKIIKYEDDKSTISDEETYESFNSVSNYIIDADVEFTYDESQSSYVATLPITKDIADKFEIAMNYDFIIDNSNINIFGSYKSSAGLMLGYFSTDDFNPTIVLIDNGQILTTKEILGMHNVKIGNPKPVNERMFFHLRENGELAITSFDFVLGDAKVLIKDEDNTEYYNNTIQLMENYGDGIIGASKGCRNNLPLFSDVYTALINGKTITIEVTQEIDGQELVSSISRNSNSMFYLPETVIGMGIYFSSEHPLSLGANAGC